MRDRLMFVMAGLKTVESIIAIDVVKPIGQSHSWGEFSKLGNKGRSDSHVSGRALLMAAR